MRMRHTVVCSVLALVAAAAVAVAADAGGSATVKARHGKLGTYVTDGKGFSLYLFEKDKRRKSSCYGACAKVWKPLTVKGAPTAGRGLKRSLLATTTRTGGAKQVTYGGHPLYYYDDDHKAGQTEGQGVNEFGAKWYVVRPSGRKLDSA